MLNQLYDLQPTLSTTDYYAAAVARLAWNYASTQ